MAELFIPSPTFHQLLDGALYERRWLIEKSTLTNAVLIPGLSAAVTGLLAGLLAAALNGNWLVIGLIASLLAWIFRPDALPKFLSLQLPQAKYEQTVKLHLIQDGGRVGDFLSLDIDPDRLKQFATGLAGGRAVACREWTGRGALFSQAEFARLRSELIKRGLARWVSDRDPRAGVILTAKGKATFFGLAALPQGGPSADKTPKMGDIKKAHTATQQAIIGQTMLPRSWTSLCR